MTRVYCCECPPGVSGSATLGEDEELAADEGRSAPSFAPPFGLAGVSRIVPRTPSVRRGEALALHLV